MRCAFFLLLTFFVVGCADLSSNALRSEKISSTVDDQAQVLERRDLLRVPSASGVHEDALGISKINGDLSFYPFSGPVVEKDNYKQILQFNHILSHEFQRAADEARGLGKFGNGLLILTAVGYGLGNTNGANSDNLVNGLIVGLGLSEGLRYFGPNPSSQAFLAASEQSACIASVGAQKLAANGNISDQDAFIVWEIMTIVQADLRRNLTRAPVGLISLATGLVNPTSFTAENQYELTRAEQRLRAHRRQEQVVGSDSKPLNGDVKSADALKYQLLGCLTVLTSGDE